MKAVRNPRDLNAQNQLDQDLRQALADGDKGNVLQLFSFQILFPATFAVPFMVCIIMLVVEASKAVPLAEARRQEKDMERLEAAAKSKDPKAVALAAKTVAKRAPKLASQVSTLTVSSGVV